MIYILDTDICVYWLKGNGNIERRSLHVGLENIRVSFITISEMYYGAYKSQRVKENINVVGRFEKKLEVIESDPEICSAFGKLKASLEKEGKIVDDADLFIAACAMITGAILVTNISKESKG
jgi:predicted nucleic acid-binding protein